MANDDIYDGTTTVAFKAVTSFDMRLDFQDVKILPFPNTGNQQVIDIGRRRLTLTLDITMITEDGTTAYTRYTNLFNLWKGKVNRFNYQRRLRLTQPGNALNVDWTIYGKIQTIDPTIVFGETRDHELKLSFIRDDKSRPNP
jgi:hypothetical protein